ncbi:hypothetical protein [Streptomyces sp. NBC_01497]|uniref:hypothetical protein n=1 Tax=Streptomyces sp. NBC_01497 TaxID=2903885 RepID=UPI002E323B20|nr:hypothetical protein [Streptomyces sp. NBC_01497]
MMRPLRAAAAEDESVSRWAQAGTASLALCFEVLLAGAVYVPVWAAEPDAGGGDWGLFGFFLLAMVPVVWGVCRILAGVGVVPLVRLVGSLVRRRRGRYGGWWFPAFAAVAGLATGLSCLMAGAAPASAGWAALAVAGALTGAGVPVWWTLRDERPVPLPDARERVWLSGGLGFTAVVAAGVLLFTVGPLHVYRPPVLTPARLVGVWADGHGGGVRLESDGFMEAVRLHDRATHDGGRVVLGPGCTVSGTWSFDADVGERQQEVRTEGGKSCGTEQWSVLGTDHDPQLYVFVDGSDLYTLTKQR